MTIRILIADDHAVVRQGLRSFLGLSDDLEVAGEAGSTGLRFEPAGKRLLKGFEAPVTLLTVERPRAAAKPSAAR